MNFSVNQNRQFYVVKNVVDSAPASEGDVQVGVVSEGATMKLFVKYFGKGGPGRTDLIDFNKLCYANLTKAERQRTYLKTAKISLNSNINGGKPIVGQDYLVRITILNYLAMGDDNVAIKHGMVHAYAGLSVEDFYKKLAKSLTMNFSREIQPLLEFKAESDGVVVTEVEQPWHRGFMQQETVNFEVRAVPVIYQGDDADWAVTNEEGFIEVTEDTRYLRNGKKIADLEYFCMGERGDQYRDQVCGALRMPVHYMITEDDAVNKEYDVLDLHYFFSDTGVNNQKSEKDIIFVAETGSILKGLADKLTAEGVTVTETKPETADSGTGNP